MRVLSGIQPSGTPHLGNYFSMMRPLLNYQDKSELFCFIANYHSLTRIGASDELRKNTLELAADFLALGLNPEKTVFWVQGDVIEVLEIAWILSTHITVPQLSLGHSYKDKVNAGQKPSASLFYYPVLMASDIISFSADRVPVGPDQKQHLEMCRDIAIRFNASYPKAKIKVPEIEISGQIHKKEKNERTKSILGLDGKKMSKSYQNTIDIFSSDKELKKSIMRIQTDSKGINESKDPENSLLYDLYSLFLSENEREELKERFMTPGSGYGEIKLAFYEKMKNYFAPYREKRERYLQDPKYLSDILDMGAKKARKIAQEILHHLRDVTGLSYKS